MRKIYFLLFCTVLCFAASSVYAARIGVIGKNSYGQFGIGSTSSSVLTTFVTLVGNDTNWVAIGAGSNHSIALKANGSLWTWGSNTMGQLGDGTTTDIYLPTQVGTKTDWKQADGGDAFTMAVKTDGTLWGWGNNASGQLGDGTNVNKLTPTQIGTDHNWMSVSCGASFTVALKTNGTLWTWGDNASGQLCDGTVINRNTPLQIGIDLDWHKIAARANNFAAIKTDSTVWNPSCNSIAMYGDLSSWNKVHVSSTGWITPTNSSVGQVNLNLGGEYVNRAQRKCYPCNTTVTDLGKAVISSVNFNLAYSGVQPAPGIEKAPQQTCKTAIPAVAIVGAGELLYIFSCSGGAYTFPKATISSDLMWGNLANGTEHILFIQKVNVKSNPEISRPIPTDITYGTALSATQLNATANVPGTFVYTPALDSVLSVGTHDLIVEFTPAFTDFYNVVRDTISITVTAKEPVITWSTPADITYSTALSTTQLNATADVPGGFVYDPAANTVLVVGDNQLLKCTFTPTDAVNYKTVSDTVYINVKSNITTELNEKVSLIQSIYPIPASDFVRIKGISGNALATITDLNGRTCLQHVINADSNISVSHLTKGIYLLKIQEDGTIKRLKLIIK